MSPGPELSQEVVRQEVIETLRWHRPALISLTLLRSEIAECSALKVG